MPSIGPFELIILLVIILLVFGSTKLPKLARSMGEASREFRKGVSEASHDDAVESQPGARSADAADYVTMSKADLDALLSEREAKARGEQPPTPPPSS